MKKLNMFRRFMALAVLLATLLCLPIASFAAEKKGSITLTYEVNGVEFRLFYVGKYENGKYVLDTSLNYDVDLEDTAAAATLVRYLKRDAKTPLKKGTTQNGKVTFSDLTTGVYVVIGDEAEKGGYTYTPGPMMLAIPQNVNGKVVFDVTMAVKYERKTIPGDDTIDITVRKVWDDDGYTSKRPDEIKVQLLCDDEVYDTVKLNKKNNWKYKWTGLDPDCDWDVVEKKVPDNYKVTIKQKGDKFVIKNTYKTPPPPSTPPRGRLPQTGQLWWPVPVLVLAGVAFLTVGTVYRRKNENET